jgi:hypothetical protein
MGYFALLDIGYIYGSEVMGYFALLDIGYMEARLWVTLLVLVVVIVVVSNCCYCWPFMWRW